MVASPEVNVDRVEDTEERKTPGDAVDNDALALGEELVDDGAEEEQVDHRPADAEINGRSRLN